MRYPAIKAESRLPPQTPADAGPLTLAALGQRFRALKEACLEGDEADVRAELRLLASDAAFLAASEPLALPHRPTSVADRQTIFISRKQGGGMGAGG